MNAKQVLTTPSLLVRCFGKVVLDQWFLTWVRSNPRCSLSQSRGVWQRSRKATAKVTLICSKYSLSYVFVKFMFCWFCSLNTVIVCVQLMHGSFLCTNKIYTCTYVLNKIIFYFFNYKGFGECTDEACRVQYHQ